MQAKIFKHERVMWLLGLVFFGYVFRFMWRSPLLQGDSQILVNGARGALTCIGRGQWSACQEASYFPLLQYFPSLFFHFLGLSTEQILRGLSLLNFIAFSGMTLFGMKKLSSEVNKSAAGVFGLALAASPLIWYSVGSFVECLVSALLLFFIWFCWTQKYLWAGILGFLLTISKETNPPFLFLVGLVSIWTPHLSRTPTIKEVRSLVLNKGVRTTTQYLIFGLVIASVANVGFNVFRFGTLVNTFYFQSHFHVPNLSQHMAFFLALLFAPNAGVFWFMPIATVVLFMGSIFGFIYGSLRCRFACGTVMFLFLVLNLGLAKWFAPFGWNAWGPRLSMPWIPGLAFLIFLILKSDQIKVPNLSTRTWWILCITVLAFGVPQVSAMFAPDLIAGFFSPWSEFPRFGVVQEDPDYYYRYMNNSSWNTAPDRAILFQMYEVLKRPQATPTLLAWFAWVIALLFAVYPRKKITES